MAEFGAHISATSQENEPSVFEVLAQESLLSAVRPAVQHACRVLAESNPVRLGWLYKYSDETFTVLDLILQSYYLKKHGASFSENFYGLKRVPVKEEENTDGSKGYQRLATAEKSLSLLCLVFVPYAKMKLDRLFEKIRDQVEAGMQTTKNITSTVCHMFVRLYPYIHMIWESTVLWYQMRYMFGKSEWHSPFLPLAGVRLQNLTELDYQQGTVERANQPLQDLSWSKWFCVLSSQALGGVAVSLSTGLSVGVFFLQFIEWWYASDRGTITAITAMPVPEPPSQQNTLLSHIPRDTDICPLCSKLRTNDTVLSTSGYVFCYPCVYKYLRSFGRCPITNYPSKTENLVKLYPPDM